MDIRHFTTHHVVMESTSSRVPVLRAEIVDPDRVYLEMRYTNCGITQLSVGCTLEELREFIGAVEQEARNARQQSCN